VTSKANEIIIKYMQKRAMENRGDFMKAKAGALSRKWQKHILDQNLWRAV
jgi:hypothetical protein